MQPVIDVAFKYKLIEKTINAEELLSPIALRAPR